MRVGRAGLRPASAVHPRKGFDRCLDRFRDWHRPASLRVDIHVHEVGQGAQRRVAGAEDAQPIGDARCADPRCGQPGALATAGDAQVTAFWTAPVDDGGSPIPTLKRLELTTSGFSIVPIAEGVEYMKIEYGVDNSPSTTNASTGLIGDGVAATAPSGEKT